tara:strand:- start:533 stop:2566 length:2034 start_codon:yes stop_codon:yes gene_type:complete
MEPKNTAQQRNRKKETMDAGLFLRMLLVLKSMLNYMKAKASGKMFHIEIQNASGRKGGIGDKGEHTLIKFNAYIRGKIQAFRQADQNKVLDDHGRDARRRRKSVSSTSDDIPKTGTADFDWDAVPFVAFVKKQVERMLAAPKYIAQQGEHAGECFFDIMFKDGAMHILLKTWARGTQMKQGKAEWFGNPNWNDSKRKNRQTKPFFSLSHKELKILLNEAAGFHTTTRRDGKKGKSWKQKIKQARFDKMQTYNAALAMAGVLLYTENGNKFKIKDKFDTVAIFVQGGSTNRNTPVLGRVVGKQVNGKLRYEVKKAKTRDEFHAPFEFDRETGEFVGKSGRTEILSGINIIRLVQQKLQDETIEFGKKSSVRGKIESFFAADAQELTVNNDKSFMSKPISQAMEFIFEQTICGGGKNGKKPKTIAEQLRIETKHRSDETLGDVLLGQSHSGMFWKLLFSLTAYSNQTSTRKLEESMGVGALNPQYKDGVKTKANRKGAEGWTERGLLSPIINWKAAAIGPKACAETCGCVLCTTAADEDYEVVDTFNEVFEATGAASYISPALLPRRGFDELPEGLSASVKLMDDIDQNGKQQELTDEIIAQQNKPSEFKPMVMMMDEWNQRNGCSFGANLISRPYDEEGLTLGVEYNEDGTLAGFASFVEIVAYPTHSGWIDDKDTSA